MPAQSVSNLTFEEDEKQKFLRRGEKSRSGYDPQQAVQEQKKRHKEEKSMNQSASNPKILACSFDTEKPQQKVV